MRNSLLSLAVASLLVTTSGFAATPAATAASPDFPGGGGNGGSSLPHLDHVFVIMMENHLKSEIIGNPNAPFMNQEATQAGQSLNYFGVGHPSLVNYLELTGGSNFGITNDDVIFYFAPGELLPPFAGASEVHVPRNAIPPLAVKG